MIISSGYYLHGGTDSGVQYNFALPNLTNYTDYYYGVSAYAYSPHSTPKVIESPPTHITVRPSRIASTEGGSSLNSDVTADSSAVAVTQCGQGTVTWRVVDPAQVTGSNYLVEFIALDDVAGPGGVSGAGKLAYKIARESDGKVIVDGADYFARTGEEAPQAKNVLAFDGLTVSIYSPAPAFDAFSVVANAAGPLSPPAWGAADQPGFPGPAGVDVPSSAGLPGQQSTIDSIFGWLIHTWPNGFARKLRCVPGAHASVHGRFWGVIQRDRPYRSERRRDTFHGQRQGVDQAWLGGGAWRGCGGRAVRVGGMWARVRMLRTMFVWCRFCLTSTTMGSGTSCTTPSIRRLLRAGRTTRCRARATIRGRSRCM